MSSMNKYSIGLSHTITPLKIHVETHYNHFPKKIAADLILLAVKHLVFTWTYYYHWQKSS